MLGEQADWHTRLWFRDSASSFAGETDAVFYFIFYVSALFFVVLMWLMVYWAFKYRRKPGVAIQLSPSHNTPLEVVWTVIPTILLFVMFFWGFKGYLDKAVAPADAEVIQVTATKWNWAWEYPGGGKLFESEKIVDKDMPVYALPMNRPVKFLMSSKDVIHSMFIPAFRMKRDVMPNRYTTQWVTSTGKPTHTMEESEPGKWRPIPLDDNGAKITDPELAKGRGYYLFCTEYCGDQHSQMMARIITLNEQDYQRWLGVTKDTSSVPLVALGEQLTKGAGCRACHSVDGSKGTGPSWKGIWGEKHQFTDGTEFVVDENYVRESILEPAKHIRVGFTNQMPSFQGRFNDRELRAIITYLKSLNDQYKGDAQKDSDTEMDAKKKGAAATTPAAK